MIDADRRREIANIKAMLASPDYRPFPLSATMIAKLVNMTPSAITNLAARPHTGVVRYPSGFDYWQVHLWMLTRDQDQACRATRRRAHLTPEITGV